KNKIAVFSLDLTKSVDGIKISITDVTEIHSSCLRDPHGLDFIDEETICVANRGGDATIFKVSISDNCNNAIPLGVIPGDSGLLKRPGSIAILNRGHKLYEALICNNDGNSITRHLVDLKAGCAVKSHDILLKKWLDLPDGISVSKDSRWIAISNHNAHN